MENQNTFTNPDAEPSEEGLIQVMQAVADEAEQKFSLAHSHLMTDLLIGAKQLLSQD